MGKYIRKRKGLGEVSVMEVAQVGVRTRARAMAAENSGGEKRRKVSSVGELRFSSSLVQLRSRSQVSVTPENSVSPADSSDRCVSASSDHVMASCCSSNGSMEKESLKFADLEGESAEIETSRYKLDRRERRETTPPNEFQAESGELESTAKPSEASSRRISMVEKMPPEAELEEFFAAAEKSIRKQFTEKYNYDIVKDLPLEGRYEWVKLKP